MCVICIDSCLSIVYIIFVKLHLYFHCISIVNKTSYTIAKFASIYYIIFWKYFCNLICILKISENQGISFCWYGIIGFPIIYKYHFFYQFQDFLFYLSKCKNMNCFSFSWFLYFSKKCKFELHKNSAQSTKHKNSHKITHISISIFI